MGIVNNILAGASGQGGDYTIARSLRFRSSASAYLNRTASTSPTSQTTGTFSVWVKRGSLSTSDSKTMFGFHPTRNCTIEFDDAGNTNQFSFRIVDESSSAGVYNATVATSAVYRDPSAWYHFVLAIDTTQATASNRIKMYVNGVQVTAFSGSPTYPSLNAQMSCLQGGTNYIGCRRSLNQFFDGYLTEVNFIDGQALTPSSFGANSEKTGVWQPIEYVGTYGTNGFYLPFTNNSTTTTLGNDSSGNGNNWTTNNISLTAGSTYDSMTDVPTLTSATAANYCVMNPLDQISTTVTNGNLQSVSGAGDTPTIRGTIGVSSGKYYWEVLYSAGTSNACHIGVADSTATLSTTNSTGANSWNYYGVNGNKFNNGTGTAYGASYTTGDVIGVALDMDAGTLTFYKNNTSQGTAFTGLTGKTLTPNLGNGTGGGTQTFQTNFGQRPFAYTPPTGFVALNTFNL
jgi:hypothetical protein